MYRLLFAFVLALGFMAVVYSIPSNAGDDCGDRCRSYEDCITRTSLCTVEICRCNDYYCTDYCVEECVAEYNSRGDCISTEKDRCKFSFPKGQERAACEAAVKDFCDCAVEEGCTDKPNGPPIDETPS